MNQEALLKLNDNVLFKDLKSCSSGNTTGTQSVPKGRGKLSKKYILEESQTCIPASGLV